MGVIKDRLTAFAGGVLQYFFKRDPWKLLGYKDWEGITFDDYYKFYSRFGLARRIITIPSEYTWKEKPEIKSDDSTFLKDFEKLSKRLKLWHYFERVDRLSGIGRFGILLIGIEDSGPLDTPVENVNNPEKIIYLTPFMENSVTIKKWNTDENSERFMKPEIYKVNMVANPDNPKDSINSSVLIHHSRVLHIAEDLDESEVFGTPRLRPVFNRFQDLQKVLGSAPEGYWRGAFKKVLFDLDPDIDPDNIDTDKLEDEIEKVIYGMEQYIKTQGVTPKEIEPNITDPMEFFEMVISAIAGAKGYPKRILLGSERGELASSMDLINFYNQMSIRQEKQAEPMILRAFNKKLGDYGVWEIPEYTVDWPTLYELSDTEKSTITKNLADALSKLSARPLTELTNVAEVRNKVFGWTGEIPDKLAEEMEKYIRDEDAELYRSLKKLKDEGYNEVDIMNMSE